MSSNPPLRYTPPPSVPGRPAKMSAASMTVIVILVTFLAILIMGGLSILGLRLRTHQRPGMIAPQPMRAINNGWAEYQIPSMALRVAWVRAPQPFFDMAATLNKPTSLAEWA